MKPALGVLVLMMTVGSQAALGQTEDPIIADVKPLIEVWSDCVFEKVRGFTRSDGDDNTLVRTALFDCRQERDNVYRALFHAKPSRSAELMNALDGGLEKSAAAMLSDKLK
jgi:hypothetical protein